jgi:hypothetical protein
MEVNLLNLERIKVCGNAAKIVDQVMKHSPEFVQEMARVIVEIVKDNKIDARDIPQLLVLIQQMYDLVHRKMELDTEAIATSCGAILKGVLHSLVEDQIIRVDETVVVLLDTLIDTSIGLLQSPLVKKRRCCI